LADDVQGYDFSSRLTDRRQVGDSTVSTATATPGEQNASTRPALLGRRQWFAVAGLVLVLVSVLPPLDLLALRFIWAESVQFCVFAMVGPALIVLGAPWRLLRLSRMEKAGQAGVAVSDAGPADRLAAQRRQRTSFPRAAIFMIAFMAVSLAWRLPPVMDALARQPLLVLPEVVTLFAAGAGLWLELVDSPPLTPRLPHPQRAAVAALSMWFTWAVAYALGFASHAVLHGYSGAGAGLSVIADQEITVALVWAVAGFCFVPVIILTMGRWLTHSEDPDEEFQRVVRDQANRATVKGWGGPSRRRPPS
jgi:cytochrome c oxidase assembly factor CtaG